MSGISLAGLACVVIAVVVVRSGIPDSAGPHSVELAVALVFFGFLFSVTGWTLNHTRAGLRAGTLPLILWAIGVVGGTLAYLERDAVVARARDLADEAGFGTPTATVAHGGDVTITRRVDGTFLVPGRVNERETRFLFDTGASAVVLTSASAELAGIKLEQLNFRVPVQTANGRAFAAPITLDSLAVGPIVVRRVRAMVVKPGLLSENLLGMTFLDKLASYEVRGNRLVLRAASS